MTRPEEQPAARPRDGGDPAQRLRRLLQVSGKGGLRPYREGGGRGARGLRGVGRERIGGVGEPARRDYRGAAAVLLRSSGLLGDATFAERERRDHGGEPSAEAEAPLAAALRRAPPPA